MQIRPEEEQELRKLAHSNKLSSTTLSSVGMQQKIKRIQEANRRIIKPSAKELITMNVEEKSKFFKKRAQTIKEMQDATGIPEYKRKELLELGINPDDLADKPLCEIKALLKDTGRATSIDPQVLKAERRQKQLDMDDFKERYFGDACENQVIKIFTRKALQESIRLDNKYKEE